MPLVRPDALLADAVALGERRLHPPCAPQKLAGVSAPEPVARLLGLGLEVGEAIADERHDSAPSALIVFMSRCNLDFEMPVCASRWRNVMSGSSLKLARRMSSASL